jgi:hypothetical protein
MAESGQVNGGLDIVYARPPKRSISTLAAAHYHQVACIE